MNTYIKIKEFKKGRIRKCLSFKIRLLTLCFFLFIILFLNCCTIKVQDKVETIEVIDTNKLSNYNADSLYKLSLKYFFEKEDTLNGNILFNIAIRKGSPDAIIDNALTNIKNGDEKKGIEAIINLCNRKVPRAYYELGKINLKKNKERGLCFLDSSVTLGYKGLAFLMSGLYYSGKSEMIENDLKVTIDTVKALYYLRISANEYDRLGQYNLANHYLELQMYDSARKYFNKCIQNNTELDEDEIDFKDKAKEGLIIIDSILRIK